MSLARALRKAMQGKPGLWRYADRRIPLIERRASEAFKELRLGLAQGDGSNRAQVRFGLEPDADLMLALAKGMTPDDGRIRHRMDKEFLAWRYKNPLSQFGFLFSGSDTLNGYLVLHTKKYGNPRDVAIVDWQAEDIHILRDMIRCVQQSGAVDSLTIWSATLSDEVLLMLRSLHFDGFDDGRGIQGFTPGVIVNSTDPQTPLQAFSFAGCNLLELANWDLRPIYSDYY